MIRWFLILSLLQLVAFVTPYIQVRLGLADWAEHLEMHRHNGRGFLGIGARREFDDPKLADLRSLPVTGFTNYLIFYRTTTTEVQVLRVIHGARDLPTALSE